MFWIKIFIVYFCVGVVYIFLYLVLGDEFLNYEIIVVVFDGIIIGFDGEMFDEKWLIVFIVFV